MIRAEAVPVLLATAISLAAYGQEALRLLLKANELISGVFDTSVPAYPLVGIFFLVAFFALRRSEIGRVILKWRPNLAVTCVGVTIALFPLAALYISNWSLSESYSFAGIALVASWTGVMIALRPSSLGFFAPYLGIYVAAVGSVDLLTGSLGDPLASVVASFSNALTALLRMPVQWASTSFTFAAAGGQPVSLYISQECSGMASISIFLLVLALIHLDLKPSLKTSAAFAMWGSLLFLFLNAVRVVLVIEGGIIGGVGVLWSLHGWVGYALYIIGFSAILVPYVRHVGMRVQALATSA